MRRDRAVGLCVLTTAAVFVVMLVRLVVLSIITFRAEMPADAEQAKTWEPPATRGRLSGVGFGGEGNHRALQLAREMTEEEVTSRLELFGLLHFSGCSMTRLMHFRQSPSSTPASVRETLCVAAKVAKDLRFTVVIPRAAFAENAETDDIVGAALSAPALERLRSKGFCFMYHEEHPLKDFFISSWYFGLDLSQSLRVGDLSLDAMRHFVAQQLSNSTSEFSNIKALETLIQLRQAHFVRVEEKLRDLDAFGKSAAAARDASVDFPVPHLRLMPNQIIAHDSAFANVTDAGEEHREAFYRAVGIEAGLDQIAQMSLSELGDEGITKNVITR